MGIPGNVVWYEDVLTNAEPHRQASRDELLVRSRVDGVATRMNRNAYHGTMLLRGRGGDCNDIFAVNPLRRSFYVVSVSWLMVLLPLVFLEGDLQALVLIAGGWIAATGIIMCTPILIWCLVEELWKFIKRRVTPSIDLLDLSPRAYNLLRRHGLMSIAMIEATPDSSLMMLSNMDTRAIREIRRAISIWRYRRWQERGFPADGMP